MNDWLLFVKGSWFNASWSCQARGKASLVWRVCCFSSKERTPVWETCETTEDTCSRYCTWNIIQRGWNTSVSPTIPVQYANISTLVSTLLLYLWTLVLRSLCALHLYFIFPPVVFVMFLLIHLFSCLYWFDQASFKLYAIYTNLRVCKKIIILFCKDMHLIDQKCPYRLVLQKINAVLLNFCNENCNGFHKNKQRNAFQYL